VSNRPDVIAHRGASALAPENTLAAFQRAFDDGADGIEGDFYLTRDNHIVCIHDRSTQRTAGKDLDVTVSTLSELQKLDVGSWKGEQWRGEHILSLPEILQLLPPGKLLYIEIKDNQRIIEPLKQIITDVDNPSHIRILTFYPDVLTAAKKRLPKVKMYWLVPFRHKDFGPKTSSKDVANLITSIGAEGVSCEANESFVTKKFVETIRAAEKELHIYDVNEQKAAKKWALAAQSITSDNPADILAALSA